MTMYNGTVKFFNTEKGFGFIKIEGSTHEVIINTSGLNSVEIQEGDDVEFDVQEGNKGISAVNVVVK